jgi:hypothetical protein
MTLHCRTHFILKFSILLVYILYLGTVYVMFMYLYTDRRKFKAKKKNEEKKKKQDVLNFMLINCETCFTFLLMRFLLVSLGYLGMDLESFRLLGGFEYPNEMYNTNRYDLMFFCVLFCDVNNNMICIVFYRY